MTWALAFLLINVLSFFLYGLDKWKAVHGRWRISERTLLLVALAGGFAGALTGMYFFHHKTGFLAFLLAAAIAFSRLYASVHYPTDVLTGAVIGVLCGIIAAWLTDRVTDQCHTLRLRKGKK